MEWRTRDEHGLYRDEFGLVWDRSIDLDIGVPHPFVSPDNLDRISWPDPAVPGRFDSVRWKWAAYRRDRCMNDRQQGQSRLAATNKSHWARRFQPGLTNKSQALPRLDAPGEQNDRVDPN